MGVVFVLSSTSRRFQKQFSQFLAVDGPCLALSSIAEKKHLLFRFAPSTPVQSAIGAPDRLQSLPEGIS